jgi:predicted enzyme related to lactoylglutathione lyase
LLLEPNDNPASRAFQSSIYEQGLPAMTFAADDIQQECERMTRLGVAFRGSPEAIDGSITAVFDDTCGNLISLHQTTS